MTIVRAIGLMSGTSLDGVDAAIIETDGERIEAFGPTAYRPFSDGERAVLRQALKEAVTLADRTARPGIIGEAEVLITRTQAETVERLFADNKIAPHGIAVVGFHGQTVIHKPHEGLTIQIGDGAALARRLGIPVVYDFRQADVAAGGQGAPLVPVFHRALAERRSVRPVVVVNIGGVANLTYVGKNDELLAFDTGPGNALIDDWVRMHSAEQRDEDGRIARSGHLPADASVLTRLMSDEFFERRPPKSLDRNHFSLAPLSGLSLADGAQVLTYFTAASIARAAGFFPEAPLEWIVTGGGRRNFYLMEVLRWHLPAPMVVAEEAGFNGDMLEAQAFAYLAVRSLRGLPITFPTTTGAPNPLTGGVVAYPSS